MRLLIDLGNTRMKWALLDGPVQVTSGVAMHDTDGEPPEWATLPRPGHATCVSVASEARSARCASWIERRWGCLPRFVTSPQAGQGLTNGYARPSQLGADRWVAMVGAWSRAGGPFCVVDCGSAVTFDAVDAGGHHLGGLIVPGLSLMRRSLGQGTAGLPLLEAADRGDEVLARSTSVAIASGTLLGLAGMIDRLVERIRNELNAPPRLWITGGDADGLLPYLIADFQHAPDLVLQGLARIDEEMP